MDAFQSYQRFLKKVLDIYRGLSHHLIMGSVDMSESFDEVNHKECFIKLINRRVHLCNVRIPSL